VTRAFQLVAPVPPEGAMQGNEFTLAEIWELCPFRSLIGRPGLGYPNAEAMAERVGAAVALIENEPSAIAADMMADIQAALAAGRTVLVLGSTREVRDHAKAEILLAGTPAGGSA
jgi:hypothetical protein